MFAPIMQRLWVRLRILAWPIVYWSDRVLQTLGPGRSGQTEYLPLAEVKTRGTDRWHIGGQNLKNCKTCLSPGEKHSGPLRICLHSSRNRKADVLFILEFFQKILGRRQRAGGFLGCYANYLVS